MFAFNTQTSESLLQLASLLLQVTCLLMFCWVLVELVRRHSVKLSHQIWSAGLIGILFIPLIFSIATPWKISVAALPVTELDGQASALDLIDRPQQITLPATVIETSDVQDEQPWAGSTPTVAPSPQENSWSFLTLPQSWIEWWKAIWVVVTLLMGFRLLLSAWCLQKIVRDSRPSPSSIANLANQLRKDLGIRQNVVVKIANHTRMPIAFWLGKWFVILPDLAMSWDMKKRSSVLAHELGHVKRRDATTDFLSQVTLALYWFHPLVWFGLSDARRAREMACDELVLQMTNQTPKDYALHLVNVVAQCAVKRKAPLANPLTSAFSCSSNMEGRVRRVLSVQRACSSSSWVSLASLSAVTCLLLLLPMVQLAVASPSIRGDADEPMFITANGQVFDENHKPYANAEVMLRLIPAAFDVNIGLNRYSDLMSRTKTDSSGRFSFDAVKIPKPFRAACQRESKHHRFELLVNSKSYGLTHHALTNLQTEAIEIFLKPKGTLSGTIVDSEGRAVEGALVEVITLVGADVPHDPFARTPDHSNFIYSSLAPSAKSNGRGQFEIENLPDNSRMNCWVHHDEHPRTHFSVVIGANAKPYTFKSLGGREIQTQTNPVQVELKSGYQAELIVTGHDGNPVDTQARLIGQTTDSRMLGSVGHYRAAVEKPGEYHLLARPLNTRLRVSRKLKLEEKHMEKPNSIEMVIPRTRILKGRVVDDTGKGVANATLNWTPEKNEEEDQAEKENYSSSAMTQQTGEFQIRVVPGKGKLFFGYQGTKDKADGVLIPSAGASHLSHEFWHVSVPDTGEIKEKKIVISRGLVLKGNVLDDNGQTVANAEIKVQSLQYDRLGPNRATAKSNSKGAYEIAGLNPRTVYLVRFVAKNGAGFVKTNSHPEHPITQTKIVNVDLQIQKSFALSGYVEMDGKPYAGMPISLITYREFDGKNTPYSEASSTVTDENGFYRLTGLMPGDRYNVKVNPKVPAIAPGWKYQSPYIQIAPQDIDEEIELDVMKLVRLDQTVSGTVVDPQGRPVIGATVSADMTDGRMLARIGDYPPPWAETNSQGEFTITHLPSEPVLLKAYISPQGEDRRIRNMVKVQPHLNQQDVKITLDHVDD